MRSLDKLGMSSAVWPIQSGVTADLLASWLVSLDWGEPANRAGLLIGRGLRIPRALTQGDPTRFVSAKASVSLCHQRFLRFEFGLKVRSDWSGGRRSGLTLIPSRF